jgi:hypothetical protein
MSLDDEGNDSENISDYLEDKDADLYDTWREECCIEFQEDFDKFIKSYLDRKNHYMSDKGHLINLLKNKVKELGE